MSLVQEEKAEEKEGKRGLWKPILLLTIVITIMVLSSVLNVGEYLKALQTWIRGMGIAGVAVFIIIYAVATVAALPGSVMTVIAGALFNPWVAVASVLFAATLGASLAFLVSRYFARDAISRWLAGKEKFRQLDELTAKHGDIMVAITRLVPLFPFNLLNYGFGLTKVPFWTYVFWSGLCMLPGTILFVVGSAAVTTALSEKRIPWILVLVVAIVIVIIAFLAKSAKRRIQEGEKRGSAASEE